MIRVDLNALSIVYAKRIGVPREVAEKYLSQISGLLFECLSRGEEIRIPHLGKLVPKLIPAHKGYNYITKKESMVPTYVSVRFKQYDSSKHKLWSRSPLNCKKLMDISTELPFEDA